jgi:hypothetical protein
MRTVKLAGFVFGIVAIGGLAACGTTTHTVIIKDAAKPPVAVTQTATPTPAAPTPATKIIIVQPQQAPVVVVPAPAAPVPEPAYFTNSTAVVQQFYQDINDGDYSDAWALGGNNIGGNDYAGWAAGFDTTVGVSLGTFSAFGSDQVQASISALQSDGTTNTYQGTYTVLSGVIVAASIVQAG